jgi:hypothetical protein
MVSVFGHVDAFERRTVYVPRGGPRRATRPGGTSPRARRRRCGTGPRDWCPRRDEDSVEEFAADAADEAFGDRVGPWRPHRCPEDADVGGGEDGVERGGELGVAIPDQKPELAPGVVEVHEQAAGQLGQPSARGARWGGR